nr:ORF6N domain-containing protein [Candidatus Brocadiales bacterium]
TVFQRLETLEQNQLITSSNIDKIFTAIEAKTIKEQTSGIFFKDQMYDAHSFISDLLRKANKSIVLIDNYIDDTTLTLFLKVPDIQVTIYTHTQTKQLKLDLEKYNQQYSNITIKIFKESHDRFLILDDNEVYLIGASLKDLGKKWFGFSKLDISSIDNILKRLE